MLVLGWKPKILVFAFLATTSDWTSLEELPVWLSLTIHP